VPTSVQVGIQLFKQEKSSKGALLLIYFLIQARRQYATAEKAKVAQFHGQKGSDVRPRPVPIMRVWFEIAMCGRAMDSIESVEALYGRHKS
jgi:hypothetical protein